MTTQIKNIGFNSACFTLGLMMSVAIMKPEVINLNSFVVESQLSHFNDTPLRLSAPIRISKLSVSPQSAQLAEDFKQSQARSTLSSPQEISSNALDALGTTLGLSHHLAETTSNSAPTAVMSALKAPLKQYALLGGLFTINVTQIFDLIKGSALFSLALFISLSLFLMMSFNRSLNRVKVLIERQRNRRNNTSYFNDDFLLDKLSTIKPKQSLFWPLIK